MDIYFELHYPNPPDVKPDEVLGTDEAGRYFRVVDVYDTTVVLSHARPEDVTRWQQEFADSKTTIERIWNFYGKSE